MTYRSWTEQIEVENAVWRLRPVGDDEDLVQIVVSSRVGFDVAEHPSEVSFGGPARTAGLQLTREGIHYRS